MNTETTETKPVSEWPGVTVLYRGGVVARYAGTMSALVATGLFRPEWFPGQPGNGVSSSTFVFTDDKGNGYMLKRGTANNQLENGFGRVSITRYGKNNFKVRKFHSVAEIKSAKAIQGAALHVEEWQMAKEARTNKATKLSQWKNAIAYKIRKFESLCTGEMVFTEMPDVRIEGDDLARVRDAVENLRRAFALAVPVIPDVVIRSNVYSIRYGAHRGLKETG